MQETRIVSRIHERVARERSLGTKALGIVTQNSEYLLTSTRFDRIRVEKVSQNEGEVEPGEVFLGNGWKIESYYGMVVFVLTQGGVQVMHTSPVRNLIGLAEFSAS